MVVKNNSSKIIGVGETSILPGATEKIPAGYEKNPVIRKYITNGTFSVVKPEKSSKKAQNDPEEEKGTLENENGQKQQAGT